MLVWKGKQRAMLADKLPDAANLALGALVFGQVFGERPYSVGLATLGLAPWLAIMMYAAVVAAGADS